jgi:hypothetical protein
MRNDQSRTGLLTGPARTERSNRARPLSECREHPSVLTGSKALTAQRRPPKTRENTKVRLYETQPLNVIYVTYDVQFTLRHRSDLFINFF